MPLLCGVIVLYLKVVVNILKQMLLFVLNRLNPRTCTCPISVSYSVKFAVVEFCRIFLSVHPSFIPSSSK